MANQLEHVWTILVQSSVTDSTTNLFSLYNTIDELTVDLSQKGITDLKDSKVTIPASFQIVSLWKRNNNLNLELKNEVKISLQDPKGKEMQHVEYPMVIPADKKRMRFITPVNGMNITIEGEYRFIVTIKEPSQTAFKKVAELPIDVVIKKHS
jgi:hypothetical protein